jgi:hypothetical protein
VLAVAFDGHTLAGILSGSRFYLTERFKKRSGFSQNLSAERLSVHIAVENLVAMGR